MSSSSPSSVVVDDDNKNDTDKMDSIVDEKNKDTDITNNIVNKNDKSDDDDDDASQSSMTTVSTPSSQVHIVLSRGRVQLWQANLPKWLSPLRQYLWDPCIQLWSIILPPLAMAWRIDTPMSKVLKFSYLSPISFMTRKVFPPAAANHDANIRSAAKNNLVHSAPPPHFQPPSDMSSAIQGSFAFIFSVSADVIGAMMDAKKMSKWLEAISSFRTYLQVSGVGGELEEAMMKPLWNGRLLDNVKILNYIQNLHNANRGQVTSQDYLTLYPDVNLEAELKDGCHFMRYATAAYGPGMIKSALDREVNHDDLQNEIKAIAFHTCIPVDDIKYHHCQDGGDMKILRHFVAVDHSTKSVVLAIRGTLSISGALVDMQAMDCDYCCGRAHSGIAEQASHIWDNTGPKILKLLQEFDQYQLVITGHSLGAGAACLVNVKVYTEELLPKGRKCVCYGFAPPPTYFFCLDDDLTEKKKYQQAVENCICFVNDNDCVPLLSVGSIRRLATAMDTIDNQTEHIWFWKRFQFFWDIAPVPQPIVDSVSRNLNGSNRDMVTYVERAVGESDLKLPARVIIWMKQNFPGKYEAFPCTLDSWSLLDIYVCEDMLTDHLPEQYEDALDMLTGNEINKTDNNDKVMDDNNIAKTAEVPDIVSEK